MKMSTLIAMAALVGGVVSCSSSGESAKNLGNDVAGSSENAKDTVELQAHTSEDMVSQDGIGYLECYGSGEVGCGVPPNITCCSDDSECKGTNRCIHAEDGTGQCVSNHGSSQCWDGSECPPLYECFDARKFGCESQQASQAGYCRPTVSGCCDADQDCPEGTLCAPAVDGTGTCVPPAQFGYKPCWRDGDCDAGDSCHSAGICRCDEIDFCLPHVGHCDLSPFSECVEDQSQPECKYVGEALRVPESVGEIDPDTYETELAAAVASVLCSDCTQTRVWKVKIDAEWQEVSVEEFCHFVDEYPEDLGFYFWPGDC